MALTEYDYTISTAFPNQKVNPTKLALEINDSSIAQTLNHIDTFEETDNCAIWFDDALSSGDQTILDTIVANHDGDPPVYPTSDFSYWKEDPDVTDDETGLTAHFSIMQSLINPSQPLNPPPELSTAVFDKTVQFNIEALQLASPPPKFALLLATLHLLIRPSQP